MIDLYFWPTPNGYKPLIFLEEAGLNYTLKPINILRGEQFQPDFLTIAPNNRIPALVDHSPQAGAEPLALFESGALLIYLAEKTGQFFPPGSRDRYDTLQWLMWQMGGVGPMLGQANHFVRYAPEDIPYGKRRYLDETRRLLKVLAQHLHDRDWVVTTYGIADMAIYPWVKEVHRLEIDLAQEFPKVAQWVAQIDDRPAVQRAYEVGASVSSQQSIDEEARRHLFGRGNP